MLVKVLDTTPGISHKIQSQEMLPRVEKIRNGVVNI